MKNGKIENAVKGFLTLIAASSVFLLSNRVQKLNIDEAKRSIEERNEAKNLLRQKEELALKRDKQAFRRRQNDNYNRFQGVGTSRQMTEKKSL